MDTYVTTGNGLTLKPHKLFTECLTLDVLWVPGGHPCALKELMNGPTRTYLDFLITRSRSARFVASVCEGALLLAAAGLLDGYEATTHWAFIPCLKEFFEVEEWASQADLDAHLVSDNFRVLCGALKLLNGPAEMRFHTVSQTLGAEAVEAARERQASESINFCGAFGKDEHGDTDK